MRNYRDFINYLSWEIADLFDLYICVNYLKAIIYFCFFPNGLKNRQHLFETKRIGRGLEIWQLLLLVSFEFLLIIVEVDGAVPMPEFNWRTELDLRFALRSVSLSISLSLSLSSLHHLYFSLFLSRSLQFPRPRTITGRFVPCTEWERKGDAQREIRITSTWEGLVHASK